MPVTIAAMCGSDRPGSFNAALLRAVRERVPVDAEIAEIDPFAFPLFTQVSEADPPEPVRVARETVRAADALLIVTPEYNYGVPGVLKNATEWFSRPFRDSVLLGKPVGFLGASSGYAGTIRAQMAWRTSWYFHKAPVFSEVEFALPFGAQHFDQDGRLIGDPSPQLLDSYVSEFVDWVRRQGGHARA